MANKVIDALGGGKRPSVLVTVNGYSFHTTIGSMKGAYKIPVSAETRDLAGIAAGDRVQVSEQLDTQPVVVEVPRDVSVALSKNSTAAEFFETLSPSQKKGFITNVEQAKTAETRKRRISNLIEALREGRRRP